MDGCDGFICRQCIEIIFHNFKIKEKITKRNKIPNKDQNITKMIAIKDNRTVPIIW